MDLLTNGSITSPMDDELPSHVPSLSELYISGAMSLLAFGGLYAVHYWNKIAVPPRLLYHDNPQNKAIMDKCPTLRKTYYPTWWASNAHLATFVGLLRSIPELELQREIIKFDDGGCLGLDWVVEPGEKEDLTRPILFVLTGLNGGSNTNYVRHLVRYAKTQIKKEHGIDVRAAIMNNRGVAGVELLTAQAYCGAWTHDVRNVLKHVRAKVGDSVPIVAVGYSLGANILTKYVGEEGENTPLTAAVSVCNPFDFIQSSKSLSARPLYNYVMSKECVRNAVVHQKIFSESDKDIDYNALQQVRRLRDFDDHFTRKVFGYKTVEDYYNDASSCNYIKDVRIPLLILHAHDDPIVPTKAVPMEAIKANPRTILASFSRGGHVGFPRGLLPIGNAQSWTDVVITEYIASILKGAHHNPASSASIIEQSGSEESRSDTDSSRARL